MMPSKNDGEFNTHEKQSLWDICVETQPTKSPDTNVLDFSFFRALLAVELLGEVWPCLVLLKARRWMIVICQSVTELLYARFVPAGMWVKRTTTKRIPPEKRTDFMTFRKACIVRSHRNTIVSTIQA
jgi:hypothetical protein